MTFDNKNNNNNTIIIDVNARRRKNKQKIFCVLCANEKVQLECINPEEDELTYRCPRCKNTYQLGFEILEHEDDFESSHEDEDIELSGIESDSVGVGLLVANDEYDDDDEDQKEGKIPIPKYMKDSQTTKVIEYREE
jgi:hypothetical protein